MKFCAISDLHGILYLYDLADKIKDVDVLLIAGDTVDMWSQKSMKLSKEWYEEDFIPWTKEINCKNIVLIGGNHDFYLEKKPGEFRTLINGTNIIYLENEWVTIGGITIYGTPLCHKFLNWAFMPDDKEQRRIIKNTVPTDRHIDILLTHDAPYGCSDQCFETMNPQEHCGSYVIREAIKKYKPTYCIHGHLHTSNHNEEILYDTKVYNVSILDEEYRTSFNPLYFEINK